MKGQCVCGAVRITIPDMNEVAACHCSTCRRWGGGPLFTVDHDGKLEIEVSLDNTGVAGFEDAEGKAEYEVEGEEREFEIEIEDVPAGSYGLFVGGNPQGTIEVAKNKGKLKFKAPQESNAELLNFDPLGEIIEVRNADNTAILEVAFPET